MEINDRQKQKNEKKTELEQLLGMDPAESLFSVRFDPGENHELNNDYIDE